MQLPEKYVNSMKELLADEFDSYMESFNEKRLYGLRVNTAKISVEDFMKICPFHIERIPWIPNGFYKTIHSLRCKTSASFTSSSHTTPSIIPLSS